MNIEASFHMDRSCIMICVVYVLHVFSFLLTTKFKESVFDNHTTTYISGANFHAALS